MHKLLYSFGLALLFGCSTTPKAPLQANLSQIHASSVFIRAADDSTGSGSIFRSRSGEYLVLTAAHISWEIPWEPVIISQAILENGRKVGEIATLADVVFASHPYYGYDIAVLRPRDQSLFTNVVTFYTGPTIPAVGTPIVHCGSPHGTFLERSITFGYIAALDRYRSEEQPFPLDFSTCTVLPGSSGGGVFLATTGELVGIISEWEPQFDSVNFFVPVRSILQFFRETELDVAP